MRKLRLLIAEDDRALANILRIVLQEEGFEVTHCRDGRVAIQTLTELRDKNALPDIILLDLNMPHVTG